MQFMFTYMSFIEIVKADKLFAGVCLRDPGFKIATHHSIKEKIVIMPTILKNITAIAFKVENGFIPSTLIEFQVKVKSIIDVS